MVNKFVRLTGGADRHCFRLAAALRQRGHDVAFLATRAEDNLEREGSFVDCTVTHDTRAGLALGAQARVARAALWNRQAGAAMERLLEAFRPDVVHAHKLYPQLSVAPIVVAARAGVPVVQTLHDFEMIGASPIDAEGRRWDYDEERFSFSLLNAATRLVRRHVHVPRVASFIAVSRFVARMHAAHGINAEVLPNFVSTDNGYERLSFEERHGVVYLGRLTPEKGVLDVVAAAKRLPAVPITIVGFGDLESDLRREAEATANLSMAGFVSEPRLDEILRRARVVVIPSRCADAGPLVPLEAMAHGTPVVAYANGGLAEYVADAGGGRVVPQRVDELAAAVADVHDEAGVWEELSRNGQTAVFERHSADAYAERLEQVYQTVA